MMFFIYHRGQLSYAYVRGNSFTRLF